MWFVKILNANKKSALSLADSRNQESEINTCINGYNFID